MRLIDADKAIEATWEQPTYTDTLNVLTEVRDRIRELPTVDAVPVIRCKDCRYWWKDARLCTHEKTCDGNITFKICCLECDADFYCGYGEEK